MELCLFFVIDFVIKRLNKKHRDSLFNLNTSLLSKGANALIIHYEFQSSFTVNFNVVAFLYSDFGSSVCVKIMYCYVRRGTVHPLLQQGVGHDLFVSAGSGCPSDEPHLAVAKLCTRISCA